MSEQLAIAKSASERINPTINCLYLDHFCEEINFVSYQCMCNEQLEQMKILAFDFQTIDLVAE